MFEFNMRRAKKVDLDEIDVIFTHGREFLRSQGLPQWQNGYGPTKEVAAGDIERGEGFVFVSGGGTVCGYAALIKGIDECYTAIRTLKKEHDVRRIPGTWDETWKEYVAIHRVALSNNVRGRGLGKKFIEELISEGRREGFCDIRIDTHEHNIIMRKVIEGAGFVLRGEIEFPFPNGERLAYQLLVPYNQE